MKTTIRKQPTDTLLSNRVVFKFKEGVELDSFNNTATFHAEVKPFAMDMFSDKFVEWLRNNLSDTILDKLYEVAEREIYRQQVIAILSDMVE